MTTYYQVRHGPKFVKYNQGGDLNEEALAYQPYRTTPLILPGAKVKKDNCQTESYLRHHPNPGMRSGHHVDFVGQDVVMKQKVADSVLHRVVGDEASNGKVFHKQFNSPIGLYSDQNIENTIKQTVPYKKTIVFDPLKSETYRALQEQGYPTGNYVQELPVPAVQPKVFSPNRLVPGKKPSGAQAPAHSPHQQQHPQQYHNVHAFGDQNEQIAQSGSFKRLMYSVLGDTTY